MYNIIVSPLLMMCTHDQYDTEESGEHGWRRNDGDGGRSDGDGDR